MQREVELKPFGSANTMSFMDSSHTHPLALTSQSETVISCGAPVNRVNVLKYKMDKERRA